MNNNNIEIEEIQQKIWINIEDGPCGSNKTGRQLKTLSSIPGKYLYLLPTKEVIEEVRERLGEVPFPVKVFHGDAVVGSVWRAIMDHMNQSPHEHEVIFATHAAFTYLPSYERFPKKADWHLVIDEELHCHQHFGHRLPYYHSLLTDYVTTEPGFGDYSKLVISDLPAIREMARRAKRDEIAEFFGPATQRLENENWLPFVPTEQYQKLIAGEHHWLDIFFLLDSEMFEGWKSITIAAANFETTAFFNIYKNDVDFVRNENANQVHDGSRIKIIYFDPHASWSKQRRSKNGAMDRMIEEVKKIFPHQKFLVHLNKPDGDFKKPIKIENGESLPYNPLGLNRYRDFDNIVFLSALNPSPAYCKFLTSYFFENEGKRIQEAIAFQTAYQAVCRTSIRDPLNKRTKTIIVPDVHLATYLHSLFPGSELEFRDIGLPPPEKKGRPRTYANDKEAAAARKRAERLRKKLAIAP